MSDYEVLDMSESTLALLIPFFAIGTSIGAFIVWMVLWHRHKARELEMRHQERMAAINKGIGLPPESGPYTQSNGDAVPPYAPGSPVGANGSKPVSKYLFRGLVWLGVGLALTLGHAPWDYGGVARWGWIAVAVGVAYLVYYSVEHKRHEDRWPPQGPSAPPPKNDHDL